MGKYAKAIVGSLVAGLTSVEAALDNGGITAQEAVKAAIATLLALTVVWAIPNSPTVTTSVVRKPDEPPTTITSRTE